MFKNESNVCTTLAQPLFEKIFDELFLGSVLPPYLTLSDVCPMSLICNNIFLDQRRLVKNCDTRKWLCAGGKHTATCDHVTNFSFTHSQFYYKWFKMQDSNYLASNLWIWGPLRLSYQLDRFKKKIICKG